MNKKILLISLALLFVIFLISNVSATQTFQKGEIIDLKIPCFNNRTYCAGSSSCSITVNYPNGSTMVSNQSMTNSNSYHNYTLPNSDVIGTYFCSVVCLEGACSGYSTFTFDITTTGFAGEGTMNYIFFIVVLFSFVLLFFGLRHGDAILIILSSFMFIISGIIIFSYPLGYLPNLINLGLALVLWGVGVYILLKTSIELTEELG